MDNNDLEKMEQLLRDSVSQLKLARNKIRDLENKMHEPIAIIGQACRLPGGICSPSDLWEALLDKKDCMTTFPDNRPDLKNAYSPNRDAPGKIYTNTAGFIEDIDLFDAKFFNISPREAKRLDPQQRILLEVTYEALENAGLDVLGLNDKKGGVFLGLMNLDYTKLMIRHKGFENIGPDDATGNTFSAAVGRLSYFYGLTGPCMAVETACSSSLVALHSACQALREGTCDFAIVGGVNLILDPEIMIMESKAHMLAQDGRCKTFDKSADGYARGEGCAVVVLKRKSDAISNNDPILAELLGSAINHGGQAAGLTVPNRHAQKALVQEALKQSNISADMVSYIEMHGTGTPLGDPIEVNALVDVFGNSAERKNPLWLGALKTNIGHLEPAAGIAGLLKVVLCLKNHTLAANIHQKNINPMLDFGSLDVKIPKETTPWISNSRERYAGLSSFGYSGVNVHVIIKEAAQTEKDKEEALPYLFPISAKDEKGLKEYSIRVREFIRSNPDISLNSIAYTMQMSRSSYPFRMLMQCKTREDIDTFSLKELPQTMQLLAEKWLQGEKVDWNLLYNGNLPKKVVLPNYPFDKKRYWFEDAAEDTITNSIELSLFSNQIEEAIREAIKEVLELEPSDLLESEKDFLEFGINSLKALEIVDRLRAKGLETNANAIFEYPTIRKLSSYLESAKSEPQKEVPNDWIFYQTGNISPKMVIYCFANAGGGPSAFAGWKDHFADDIALGLIQLPGRERRSKEKSCTDIHTITNQIIQAMGSYSSVPFVFFGHSLGAQLAAEVAREMQERGLRLPQQLFLSCFAPIYKKQGNLHKLEDFSTLSDEAFIQVINQRFGGIPESILKDQKMMQQIVPALRVDLSIFTSNIQLDTQIDAPVRTISCQNDHEYPEERVKKWHQFFRTPLSHTSLAGSHLSILTQPEPFIDLIIKSIANP